jgi:antirestriction protein ArdC
MANKLYREITNAILAKLEKGVVPWRKDWRSTASAAIPHNVVSKRPYSGVNVILLWLKGQQRGWSSLEFLIFKQAAEAGGTVRHGEKSTGIVFVKQLQVPDRKEPEKIKLVPILRAYRVHVTQCENLPESLTRPLPKAPRNQARIDSGKAAGESHVATPLGGVAGKNTVLNHYPASRPGANLKSRGRPVGKP